MFIRRYGMKHVVDMDLSKCFDKLDRELILKSIRKRVSDGSALELINQFLKSGVMIDGVKFLGVEIGSRFTRIQSGKLERFKKKLQQMTKRNGGKPLIRVIKELNPVLRRFSQYFRVANAHREFKRIAGWLRRRLRSIQLKLWKRATRLHRLTLLDVPIFVFVPLIKRFCLAAYARRKASGFPVS